MKYSKLMLSTAAAVSILGVGAASAADLPVKARPYVAPPVFSWTGCYAGGHVGWGWGRQNTSNDFVSFTTSTVTNASGRVDSSGAVFGGQVGCDYQFAGGWVLGVQGSISATNIWGSNVDPRGAALDSEGFFATDSDRINRVKTDWIADATVRLGYAFGQQLFYVKGGGAWARNRWDLTDTLTGLPFGERLETRTGWTVGVGYEWAWAFAPGWTSFIEYNHYDFGTRNLNSIDDATGANPPFRGNQSLRFDVKQTIEIAKVGVNYRFNLGKSPVVARY